MSMCLWLFLNWWAFVLLLLGGAIIWAGVLLILHNGVWWQLVLIVYFAAIFIVNGYRLFLSYPTKKRIYRVLVRRNLNGLRLDTFKNYLGVPCHRLIVIAVLWRTGRINAYPKIWRRYYVAPWKCIRWKAVKIFLKTERAKA